MQTTRRSKIFTIVTMFALVLNFVNLNSTIAQAASLTNVSDIVSSMKASTAANHTISFRTSTGVLASDTIALTFDAGYNISSITVNDIDLSDDGADIAVASAVVSGQVLTITNGASVIAPASVIAVKIGSNAVGGVNQIVNGVAGNNKVISIAGTFGDSGALATAWLGNDTVILDATVNPTLTFGVSVNTLHFGSLSTTGPRWANDTTGSNLEASALDLTVATNALNGYTLTYMGPTLTSGANTINAATFTGANGTAGTEQFAASYSIKTPGTGSTVSADYLKTGDKYSFVPGVATTFASGLVATDTTVYSAYYLANIANTTEAGAYATAITYVGTGNF